MREVEETPHTHTLDEPRSFAERGHQGGGAGEVGLGLGRSEQVGKRSKIPLWLNRKEC